MTLTQPPSAVKEKTQQEALLNSTLENLTPAQREAVTHLEGPLLILAGPGSGKTRVITHRIAYLITRGIPAGDILALTFTNKAADEMRTRLERLAPHERVWVGTFHRFCAQLLRKYAPLVGLQENYTIYDADDARRTLRRTLNSLQIDTTHLTPDAIYAAISWAKSNLISPQDYHPRADHLLGSVVARVYPAYQARLAQSNAADFDDLLLHVANLLRENPEVRQSLDRRHRFVLVDEYQDTNLAQYAIARALSIDHPNLAVTGDPDQSIYGWRGANLNNILEFEKDYTDVRVVRLERNYRSTARILHVAADLIAHNVKRKQKDLYTENGQGQPVRLVRYATHKDEAQMIAARIAQAVGSGLRRPRDFAIFYRVNALSRAFELALRAQNVPYQVVHGLEFFKRQEIKDVLAYLHLLCNPADEEALLRVINTPNRGIGKRTVERLADYAARHGVPLLDAARTPEQIAGLSKRTLALVGKFVALFDRLAAVAGAPVEEILGSVIEESGYKAQLAASEHEEDQERLANIEELLSVGREFDERHPGGAGLEAFLEEMSLVGDVDDWETESDRVTLMTLHASKGLEFPVVFLVAVEDGLLPHERSRDQLDSLEEERRLMFVGITRAQQELQISLTQYRDFRGRRRMTIPSSFLMELPRAEMDIEESAEPVTYWPTDSEPFHDTPEPLAAGENPRGSLGATAGLSGSAECSRTVTADTAGQASSGAQGGVVLTTAAELAGEASASTISPDAFHQGMLVRHPLHGLGRVIALSGSGPARKATVDFGPRAGRKRLVLAASPLRPVLQANGNGGARRE